MCVDQKPSTERNRLWCKIRDPKPASPYSNDGVPNILPQIKAPADGDDARVGAYSIWNIYIFRIDSCQRTQLVRADDFAPHARYRVHEGP